LEETRTSTLLSCYTPHSSPLSRSLPSPKFRNLSCYINFAGQTLRDSATKYKATDEH